MKKELVCIKDPVRNRLVCFDPDKVSAVIETVPLNGMASTTLIVDGERVSVIQDIDDVMAMLDKYYDYRSLERAE